MSNTAQSQQVATENLRKHLAVAVRSIQWSYAIFWSLSTKQQGVLEWVDGYYNGDIKTMKTVQAMQPKHDKMGLQRSVQLRELYKSLLEGEIDQQAKRPTAALSPEDLSDAEWYYLVCMSFVFNPGESLPGKALANKETMWLCNAQYADSKVFARSLLAKSASIQTVVCFPHLNGVIELGVTELVPEDPNLIQHIKTSLLDFSKPVCSEKSSSSPHDTDDNKGPACAQVNHETIDLLAALENLYTPMKDIVLDQEQIVELTENIQEELNMDPPEDCSNGSEHNNLTEDSMLEGLNGGASNVQSWHFMDDGISNGFLNSLNSTDCLSEVNEERIISSPKDNNATHLQLKELQKGNHTELSSLDLGANDDVHYRRTLSLVLGSSSQLIGNSCFCSASYKSSFVPWKKQALNGWRPQLQQNMLKKILLTVPLMHGHRSPRLHKENGGKDCRWKLESNEVCKGLSDKQRENENFFVLKSMIPIVSEIDKASILDEMIRYVKELETRMEELESCRDSIDYSTKQRENYPDMAEQISVNYDNSGNGKKPWINKRKVSDIDETDPELNEEDSLASDVKVSMKEEEVFIELKCAYREYILLDIMDEINNLHLDVHSVQSSTVDGILILNLKSKFREAAVAPARMFKKARRKIGQKS